MLPLCPWELQVTPHSFFTFLAVTTIAKTNAIINQQFLSGFYRGQTLCKRVNGHKFDIRIQKLGHINNIGTLPILGSHSHYLEKARLQGYH